MKRTLIDLIKKLLQEKREIKALHRDAQQKEQSLKILRDEYREENIKRSLTIEKCQQCRAHANLVWHGRMDHEAHGYRERLDKKDKLLYAERGARVEVEEKYHKLLRDTALIEASLNLAKASK